MQLLRSLSVEDFEKIGTEVKSIVNRWDEKDNPNKCSNFLTISQVVAALPNVEKETIETFFKMARERRQVEKIYGSCDAFSIVKPEETRAMKNSAPWALPKVWKANRRKTFKRGTGQKVARESELGCSFFGCSYIGSAATISRHYVI